MGRSRSKRKERLLGLVENYRFCFYKREDHHRLDSASISAAAALVRVQAGSSTVLQCLPVESINTQPFQAPAAAAAEIEGQANRVGLLVRKGRSSFELRSYKRLFLFWTVHGPFSLFLRQEKEKMGGGIAQPPMGGYLPPRGAAARRNEAVK